MGAVQVVGLAVAAVALVLLVVRPIWGLYALIVFYPFHGVVPRVIEVSGFNWPTVLMVVAALSMVVRHGFVVPPLRMLAPILAFYFVMLFALAITFSTWTFWNFPATKLRVLIALKLMLWPTLMFFIGYGLATSEEKRQGLITAIVVSATVAALAPLFGIEIERPEQVRLGLTDPRAAGMLKNPNHLGMILSFISVVPLIRFFDRNVNPASKLAYAGVWAIQVVSLILSLSRRAWLGALASHATWLWCTNRIMVLPALVAAVLMLTIGYAFLPELVRDRIEHTFTTGDVVIAGSSLESSAAARIAYYRIGFDMWTDSPLIGLGFESFLLQSTNYGARYGVVVRRGPHSVPLRALAETGLIGFCVLLWMFTMAVLTARSLLRREGPDRLLGVFFASALASVAVASFFGNVLNHTYVTFFFWSTWGIAARAQFQPAVAADPEEPAADDLPLIPARAAVAS